MFANNKITTGLVVLALAVSSATASCLTPPVRVRPGRDISFGNTVCPSQMTTCAALCGGKTLINTCVSNNGGSDNPFESITYCYICTCKDLSTPDLESYSGTVPTYVCQRKRDDCEYPYDQVGQSPPAGACGDCAVKEAAAPAPSTTSSTTTLITAPIRPTPKSSSVIESEVETTTTSAKPASTTTSSTSTLSLVTSTTTTSSVSSTSSSSSSSQSITTTSTSTVSSVLSSVTSAEDTTTSSNPLITLTFADTPTSTLSASARSSSTGAAGCVEPAMGFLGMALAAAAVVL
ncbi:hypothetical protein B0T22DRAFT_104224 [Podospora appendiculata]|uniref:DUF7707 domain-containing protein n=1 Tax=Podospora appendiculata TaxID=314037 RepID=A0AAE0XL16_9PEZI|nr:hypothetical protein B0T22DRAFT_104224 [Podospora appendiculata]